MVRLRRPCCQWALGGSEMRRGRAAMQLAAHMAAWLCQLHAFMHAAQSSQCQTRVMTDSPPAPPARLCTAHLPAARLPQAGTAAMSRGGTAPAALTLSPWRLAAGAMMPTRHCALTQSSSWTAISRCRAALLCCAVLYFAARCCAALFVAAASSRTGVCGAAGWSVCPPLLIPSFPRLHSPARRM